jgi:hypothetical protein
MEILRKIIFVFICAFPFVGISQITFYKKYTGGPFDQGNGLTQLPDSSYAVTGTSAAFDNNSGQAFLMITDSLGNQKWTKNYGGFGEDIGVRVIHVPNDGFFIAGFSGSTSNGNFDFVLYKTDEQGNLLWEKMYGGLDWEQLHDAALLSDGGLILVGETEGFSSQKKDIFMVRTTPLGDTVWTKTIQTPEDDYVSAVEVLSPTEFIIGGNKGEFGLSKGMLASYNIDGTENWIEFLDQAGITRVNDITIHQSNIYAAGDLQHPVEDKTDIWFVKTDLTGGFVGQEMNPFYTSSSFYNTIVVNGNNKIYLGIMSETQELNPYPGGLDASTHCFLYDLSFSSGESYSGFDEDFINNMIVTNDGGVAFVGTVSDDPGALTMGTNVMLVKIGLNDEITSFPDLDLDLVSVMTEEKKTFLVHPNPTSSFINIPNELNNNAYELRNIQGQIVKSGKVTSQIFMHNLENGIYFLNINDQNQIWSTKIIKK